MKSNVALLTWWHYHNYGSALQATALSKTISSLGHNVDMVNYEPSGKRFPTKSGRKEVWTERFVDKQREQRFESYSRKHFSLTGKCQEDEEFAKLNDQYDFFVSGSDQIWAPVVFDARYFQDFVTDNRKKVAYAPSIGMSSIENEWIRERMTSLMSQFAHLSVREKQGAELASKLIERPVEALPDPTLLLDYNEWRKIIPKQQKSAEKYILCYFLGENPRVWNHAKSLSNKTGLPIKILPVFPSDADHGEVLEGVGPEEFFNTISNAEIVLTDSFHGAIFSIICSRPFYVFERFRENDEFSQNSRTYNLLALTDLNERLIKYDEDPKRHSIDVDFTAAHKAIEREKHRAITYLKTSLSMDTPLVSVLVPAYKVEKYIKKCLDSITAQTYKNLEIIVVDDGTPDKSGEIADECAKKDKRIRVIHKANGGLSSARNAGLDEASGEYVVFVDSDDVVAPTFIEYMLGLIEISETNIAASLNCFSEYWDGVLIENDRFELWPPEKAIEGIYAWFYREAVWNKIYKRSYIEKYKLRFRTELLSAEGMTFNIMALQTAGPVAIGQKQLYFQTFNPNSATRSTDIPRWETCFMAYDYQKKNSRIMNDRIRRAFDYHVLWGSVSIARQIYKAGEEEKYAEYLKKYKRNIRRGFNVAMRANISKDAKRRYLRIFLNPKKELTKINQQEAERVKVIGILDTDTMPWDKVTITRKNQHRAVSTEQSEIERLKEENMRLSVELASHLSIKRASRLLLGNIKRRIHHGKNR